MRYRFLSVVCVMSLSFFFPKTSYSVVSVCNNFSANQGEICTGDGGCQDFSAADAGAAACTAIDGIELSICSSGSTNQGFPCTNDNDCPDESTGDGIPAICGVAVQAIPGTSKYLPLYRHPRGAGSASQPAMTAEAIIAIAQRIPALLDNCIAEYTLATEGQQCISRDDDTYVYCKEPGLTGSGINCDDASEWGRVTTGTLPTLQQIVDNSAVAGKVTVINPAAGIQWIADTAAEATQHCQAAATNCLSFYAASGAPPTIAGVSGSPLSLDAPAGQDIILKFAGVTGVTYDNTGAIQYAGNWRQRSPLTWLASSLTPDGTVCARSAELSIRGHAIVCAGSGGTITGMIETRDNFDSSVDLSADFTIETETTGAQTWSGDLACFCAGAGEARPTAANLDGDTTNQITITTGAVDGILQSATVTGIACGGTCQARDFIFYRITTDAANTATNDFFLASHVNFTQDATGED